MGHITRQRSLWLIAIVVTACSTPVVIPQPSVTTPEAVPLPKPLTTQIQTAESAEAGTIETVLGTFSWRHLSGDVDALPYPGFVNRGVGVVATPSGYAAISSLTGSDGNYAGFHYLRSSDGYEWTPEAFPVPVEADFATLEDLGGGYWLTTFSATPVTGAPYLTSVWRSDDGESWLEVPLPEGAEPGLEPMHDVDGTIWLTSERPAGFWRLEDEGWVRIDPSAFTPPDIAGVEWSLESENRVKGGPATVGEITLVPWDLKGSPDYGFGEWYSIWDSGTRTMGLWDPSTSGRTPVATLSVEADGNRFIFIDEAGSVVHEITINDDRLDAATLFEGPSFGNFRQLNLGVLDGEGRVTASIPPWADFDSDRDVDDSESYVALLAIDSQFLAFVTQWDQTGSTVELWTSTDGLSWSGPQRPGFLPEDGEIDSLQSVRAEGDVVLAELEVGDHTEVWVSDDGISWTDTGLSVNNNGPFSLTPFGSGGIYVGATATTYEMFVSTDLRTWERVDTSQLGMRPFDEYQGHLQGVSAADDAIFLTLMEDATGTRDMWVLELNQ